MTNPAEFVHAIGLSQLPSLREQMLAPFLNKDGSITLWTQIPEQAWQVLVRDTRLYCPDTLSDPDFAMAYAWKVRMMEHCGIARLREDASPLWCWVNTGYGARKPRREMRSPDKYLVTLKVDPARVLPSDFHMWHFCLNYWPICVDDDAAEALEEVVQGEGLNFYRTKPLPSPWHDVIEQSWLAIFDPTLNNGESHPHWSTPYAKMIQAVLWEIRLEDVVHVAHPFE